MAHRESLLFTLYNIICLVHRVLTLYHFTIASCRPEAHHTASLSPYMVSLYKHLYMILLEVVILYFPVSTYMILTFEYLHGSSL